MIEINNSVTRECIFTFSIVPDRQHNHYRAETIYRFPYLNYISQISLSIVCYFTEKNTHKMATEISRDLSPRWRLILYALNLLEEIRYTFALYTNCRDWYGVGCWNICTWKALAYSCYLADIMAAHVWRKLLVHFSRDVPASAQNVPYFGSFVAPKFPCLFDAINRHDFRLRKSLIWPP